MMDDIGSERGGRPAGDERARNMAAKAIRELFIRQERAGHETRIIAREAPECKLAEINNNFDRHYLSICLIGKPEIQLSATQWCILLNKKIANDVHSIILSFTLQKRT